MFAVVESVDVELRMEQSSIKGQSKYDAAAPQVYLDVLSDIDCSPADENDADDDDETAVAPFNDDDAFPALLLLLR